MSEDDFEPRLGRMRAGGSKQGRRYLQRILAAAGLAGGIRLGGRRRFVGSIIGRGGSVGRLLADRSAPSGFSRRRVVVKTRIARLGGRGRSAALAHLRYLQRDGVTRDGERGELYGADDDAVDGKAFLTRSGDDRHQFRIIVAPEDGAEFEDLKSVTRRLMTAMESDLGTRLEWVAVDHFNTGNPHTHIILRGRDDQGKDLVIVRDYVAHGMRERAADILSRDLGPRTILDHEASVRREITAERLTGIDRRLVRAMDSERVVAPVHSDPFEQAARAGRLQTLGSMGLAEKLPSGRWRLDENVEPVLRTMGMRGDIIRTMQQALSRKGIARPPAEFSPPGLAVPEAPIVGRLVARGLADELDDRHFLVLDAIDGRTHYVEAGKGHAIEPLPDDAIIRVAPRSNGVRDVDRTIVAVAAYNGGRYDRDAHARFDPEARAGFIDAHVRRLEAMRRMSRNVERDADGSWTIAPDHLERATAYEGRLALDAPVTVEILSPLPLPQLASHDGDTWLDRALDNPAEADVRDTGFGAEVRAALAQRRQWLIAQDLAAGGNTGFEMRPDAQVALRARAVMRVAAQLSKQIGLPYEAANEGDHIAGTLRRRVDLAGGRFALVERAHDFTLVPWRPSLERHLGKDGGGILRSNGISWTAGRERGGPQL